MREIKFRAWDKTQELMIRHELIALGWSVKKLTEDINFDVMQYIGLKDKNGKEICEGDIVRFTSTDWMAPPARRTRSWIGKVEFRKYSWALVGEVITELVTLDDILRSKMEVIGNLYENPELIK